MTISKLTGMLAGQAGAGLFIRLMQVGSVLLLNILLARYLGPDGFGSVSFTVAWVMPVVSDPECTAVMRL